MNAVLAPGEDNGSAPGPIPFAEFRSRLRALYGPPLRAPSTLSGMMYALDQLEALGNVVTTADLTTATIARFIAARPEGEHPNYTHTLVARVRAACNLAAAEGWVRVSPFAVRKHWVRRVRPSPPGHHSREEIARVLGMMRADVARKKGWAQWRARRLLAMASVFAYTGLRKNEGLRLKVGDVNLESRMILIVPRVGNRLKTEAAAQPVPMPEALVTVLGDWLPHCGGDWLFPNWKRDAPWTGGSPGYKPLDRLKRLGERAGVDGFTFQSLRHSWATHAEFWGLSDAMIQRVLRHTNTRTQWHYRHADAENMRGKVGPIDFGPPPKRGSEGRPEDDE